MGQEGESACVIEGVETREGLCSQMVMIRLKVKISDGDNQTKSMTMR